MCLKTVLLCSPGWPRTHNAASSLQTPQCWDCKGTSFFSPTRYSPICFGLFVSACIPEASPTGLLAPKLATPPSCPWQNELSAVETQPSASRLRPPTVSLSVLTLASPCSTDHMASFSFPTVDWNLPCLVPGGLRLECFMCSFLPGLCPHQLPTFILDSPGLVVSWSPLCLSSLRH